jgi:voltage-gated potassium channel Kch
VAPGDRVTLLGKPEELAGAELSHAAEPEPVPGQGGRLRQFLRRASRTLAQGTDRAVWITLVLAIAMLVISTIVLSLAYHQGDGSHLSLSQAIYFTVETFATVGFGDFSFAHQSTGLQVFGIALIVAGVTLSTVILALITNALVSRRIEQSLGQGSIKGMEGHVVLVGLGAVGLRVLEGLRAQGRDVVVVERDESNRYVQHARGLGAPVVHGDATLARWRS